MSQQHDDDTDEASHPRETAVLFGHAAAEAALLAAYRAGRMPHGILITGPKGIGKATLAYRIARFVLSHPDPGAKDVQDAVSLKVDPTSPVARRIAAQAQPDLLVIERTVNERGVLRNQIAVDDIRRTVPFFGSTAGEGGWRITIVDAVDDLNRSGANALLKVLEEPPKRGLLLLIAHSTARVPSTLRSRCRIIALRPLVQEDVAAAVAAAGGIEAENPEIAAAAAGSDGSVARALILLAVLFALLLVAPWFINDYLLTVLIVVLYFAFTGQAWNIMMGFAGQLSLGHAIYAGLGGYITAVLFARFGIAVI